MATYTARKGPRAHWTAPTTWMPKGQPGPQDHVYIPIGAHLPICEPGEAKCLTLTIIEHANIPKG